MKKRLKILVTAGPTQENIDPVRFISNRSTGVMGYEIAEAARRRRHRVTLISGPTNLEPPGGVKFLSIMTAEELRRATLSQFKDADCLFMVAAVSDWRVSKVNRQKIRRSGRRLSLSFEPTPDILEEASGRKGSKIVVGFSLETGDTLRNAREKLKKKCPDMIVVNSLSRRSSPFGHRKIKSFILYKTGEVEHPGLSSKRQLAGLLLDRVEELVSG